MKFRSGFVSNSSSSSFCIYGTFIEDGELDGDLYEKAENMGLECHSFDGCDGHYVGVSWSGVKDEETGKQFKERVENLIAEFCGQETECDTYEEAYYS